MALIFFTKKTSKYKLDFPAITICYLDSGHRFTFNPLALELLKFQNNDKVLLGADTITKELYLYPKSKHSQAHALKTRVNANAGFVSKDVALSIQEFMALPEKKTYLYFEILKDFKDNRYILKHRTDV